MTSPIHPATRERVSHVTAHGSSGDQPEPLRPYPQGPPGTKRSPSDKYFQDLTYYRAKNSLLLGLSSILCCGFLTGIPAIWIGLRALRDIDASNGRLRGRRSAMAGIVLGVIGSLVVTTAAYRAAGP
jgi:hypothetical protein